MGETVWERDVARGMYGGDVPVRPTPTPDLVLPRCLNGHDLKIARVTLSHHHLYGLAEVCCSACYELREPRPRWCQMDPARQYPAESAPAHGLVLVRRPPPIRGGVGTLQLRLDGVPLGDLDLAVCGPCRRAVLERVRVDPGRQRRGFGRVLVAAALVLAPPEDYRWSTTRIESTVARAFWAGVGWPGELGEPAWCTDMQRASGVLPDW